MIIRSKALDIFFGAVYNSKKGNGGKRAMPHRLLRASMGGCFNADGYFFQQTLGRPLMGTPHSHDFYEVICVLSGSCVHSVNGAETRCAEGDLFFLRPSDLHALGGQTEGTNVAALSVVPSEVEKFLCAYGLSDDFALTDAPPRARLRSGERTAFAALCDRLFALPAAERTPLCRVLLGEVLAAIIKGRDQSESAMPPSFAALLAEMNRPANAAGGVSVFLRLSNFSHAQLCRLTRKYLGMTPRDYVNTVRMKYAWELVVSSEESYEAICESVGFSSFSHFCRLFVKTYGVTPAKARKSRSLGARTI